LFKKNVPQPQETIFTNLDIMDPRLKGMLEKSWAHTFFYEVFCHINEAPFAVLYANNIGAPNFPVNILISLEYIKAMFDLSDAELFDRYRFDYQVNYAVGQRSLGERWLSERTLYNFRSRIYQHYSKIDCHDLLGEQFQQLLQNFVRKSGVSLTEQRIDSTMFMSNIRKAGRLALAFDTLVFAAKAAVKVCSASNLPEWVPPILEDSFRTEVLFYSKSSDNENQMTKLLRLGQELSKLLHQNPGTAETLDILDRFLSDQAEKDENGLLVPRNSKEISGSSLQSPHDPDASYRKKSGTGQSGYTLTLTETCADENEMQLITGYEVNPNIISDVAILEGQLEALQENGCRDLYGDGGYHSPALDEDAKEKGMNIHVTAMTGTQSNAKLPLMDYQWEDDIIYECPGGEKPFRTSVNNSQTIAYFKSETCAVCPMRDQCQAKKSKSDYVVRISLKSLEAVRKREAVKATKRENTSKRAGIEGTNSALKRTGLGKLRVRGQIKCAIVCGHMVMAQNIKRLFTFLSGGYKDKNSKRRPAIRGIFAPI
jgi:hypothetical protein